MPRPATYPSVSNPLNAICEECRTNRPRAPAATLALAIDQSMITPRGRTAATRVQSPRDHYAGCLKPDGGVIAAIGAGWDGWWMRRLAKTPAVPADGRSRGELARVARVAAGSRGRMKDWLKESESVGRRIVDPDHRVVSTKRITKPALVVVLLIVGWRVTGRQCADERGIAKVVCVMQHMR